MTDEKLEFANMLKNKIEKLDREIYLLMDLYPPIRTSENFLKGRRGWIQKIRDKKLIHKKRGKEIEIELSNEDGRALVDIRAAERNALKQILNEIE